MDNERRYNGRGQLEWRRVIRVDPCLANLISFINKRTTLETLASCCGHGKYSMSIVVGDEDGIVFELLSQKIIKRKIKYYVKDSKGFFYSRGD